MTRLWWRTDKARCWHCGAVLRPSEAYGLWLHDRPAGHDAKPDLDVLFDLHRGRELLEAQLVEREGFAGNRGASDPRNARAAAGSRPAPKSGTARTGRSAEPTPPPAPVNDG